MKLLILPLLFLIINLSFHCYSQDRPIFDLNMEAGYEALAGSDYDKALKFFNDAQKSDVLKQKKEENLAMYVDELIKLTAHRKALGEITPKYTHRAMVLYVNNVDFEYKDSKGKKVVVKEKMTDADKSVARVRQLVTKQLYEAMSQGNFSIEFIEQQVDEPLTVVKDRSGRPWPDWHAYEKSGSIFIDNIDSFDTFIWCTTAIHGEAHGGSGRFPLGYGHLSPERGFIEVNPRHSINIWVHEFFHVVENMAGISPSHGHHKENKGKFPDWKGPVNNSLNYYNWHFNSTIPQKGWDKLKFDRQFSPVALKGSQFAGAWKANDITEEWKIHEWDLDKNMVTSEEPEVVLLYTHGWKAIDIAWVALYNGDEQIAIDEHFGFSGAKKIDIVYKLKLEENPKGKLRLKVKMKGDGGTDSNGLIMIK